MRYDRLGFPIPSDFDPPVADGAAPAVRSAAPGRGKRLVVLGLLAAVIVPGLMVPAMLPIAREAIVRWSIQRAFGREARGQSLAAIGEVGRALAWSGDDAHLAAELLCWRAMLRIDARDAIGAVDDAARAAGLEPTATQPRRVSALANVILSRPDEALADAEAAVELAGGGDPEALNHRAYIRALVGRDLPAALADIDAAMVGGVEAGPEFLDTRGYVLHLLGRNQEAIDQLNLAIAAAEQRRRDVVMRARQGGRVDASRQLRAIDRDLAVMHRHRGLACRAAGLERQAEQDLEIADRKGYDPSRGVM
jgi:hypothetical protein